MVLRLGSTCRWLNGRRRYGFELWLLCDGMCIYPSAAMVLCLVDFGKPSCCIFMKLTAGNFLSKADLLSGRLLCLRKICGRFRSARILERPVSHERVRVMEKDLAILVEEAKAGKDAAMVELFTRFEGMLRHAAYQRHLRVVAEDAYAEAQVSFLRAVRMYDGARGVPFEGWAKAKVYGDLRSFFRRERLHWQREVMPEDSGDGASFWDALADAQEMDGLVVVRELLRQGMQRLSDKERELLELIFVADCTQKEAAKLLGMSQQAAAVVKGRGVRKLRAVME